MSHIFATANFSFSKENFQHKKHRSPAIGFRRKVVHYIYTNFKQKMFDFKQKMLDFKPKNVRKLTWN